MSIIQKIALSIMTVLFVILAFFALSARAEADKKDKTEFNKTVRTMAKMILVFGLALIVFVLGFIW